MSKARTRYQARHKRHRRVRRKIVGTDQRPRLSVFRSARHIYAQLIDDRTGRTLAAAASNEPALRQSLAQAKPLEQARVVGETLAARAQTQGVSAAVFDRGGFQFHGRIRALAEGSRAQGLQF